MAEVAAEKRAASKHYYGTVFQEEGSKLGVLVRLRRLHLLRGKLMDKAESLRAEGKDKEKDYGKIYWVPGDKFHTPNELYWTESRIGLNNLNIFETLEQAIGAFLDENRKIRFKNVDYYQYEESETIRFERRTGNAGMVWGYLTPFKLGSHEDKWGNAFEVIYTEHGKNILSKTYSMAELYTALRQIYLPASLSTD